MNMNTNGLTSAMSNDVIFEHATGSIINDAFFTKSDIADNTITLHCGSQSEMLKITKDGFYVRGVKVEQDEREAEVVYKAFHQWMMWATLNRSFN